MLKHIVIAVCGLAFAVAGVAKLPAPTPEQQAAAALNAAKAAHAGKVDAYALCMSQTKVADAYVKEQKAEWQGLHARGDTGLRESRPVRAAGRDTGRGRCAGAARSGTRCRPATCSGGRQEVAIERPCKSAPWGAFVVRPAWARSSGCKSPAELATARQAKRNCARATERGEEAWSVNREPRYTNRI